MKKLTETRKKQLNAYLLEHPAKSDTQIGSELGLAQSTVSHYRKEMDLYYDMEFVKMTAGIFIKASGEAMAYWNNQIDKLEDLKGRKKTIFKKGSDGQTYPEEVDLEPMDILAIEKEQASLKSKILYLGAQSQVREVIKLMRSGDISALTN